MAIFSYWPLIVFMTSKMVGASVLTFILLHNACGVTMVVWYFDRMYTVHDEMLMLETLKYFEVAPWSSHLNFFSRKKLRSYYSLVMSSSASDVCTLRDKAIWMGYMCHDSSLVVIEIYGVEKWPRPWVGNFLNFFFR